MAGFMRMSKRHLQAEATGTVTQVPNNPHAKLCYYLACVQNVGEANFPAFVTNYKAAGGLTQQQKRQIVQTARRYHPNRVMRFLEVDDVPGGSNNEFLKLSSLEESLTAMNLQGAAGGVLALRRQLGGRQAHGTIMLHNDKWERDNYHQPMRSVGQDDGGANALVGMLALMALAASANDSDSD